MISQQVKSYIPIIAHYFKKQPVVRAWIFGSCSRGEETAESDVDILVDYDPDYPISLMKVSNMRNQLIKLLQRPIDLVENGCLMPFAEDTANRDKILIYER